MEERHHPARIPGTLTAVDQLRELISAQEGMVARRLSQRGDGSNGHRG